MQKAYFILTDRVSHCTFCCDYIFLLLLADVFFYLKNEESLSDDDGQEEGKVLGKKILLYSKSSKDTVGLPEIKTL